ncbi:MAG: PAS domain-containing protein, partial [Caldilineaceae bacterium]|nr:PAS domain-containing protein [Caldilineaceae bacterium]
MQILYEIAISIGVTLDLRVMLTTALDVFLRQLNCTSGAIYVARPSNPPQEPTTAIPRNLRHNEAVAWVQRTIQAAPEWQEWPALLPSLSQSAHAGGDLYVHGLALGNLGFMVLARPAQPLDDEMLNMLSPLLIKLTESSRACLQNEQLATAHQSILWERNMLRSLIEATPTILYSLDKEGHVLYCEGRGLQLLGLDAEQVRGVSVYEVYAEIPGAIEAVQTAMAGRQASPTYELEGRSLDVVLQPVVDARGDLHGVVGVSYDVTERKTAIDTLTAVLNSVGEGVVTVREPA